MTQAPEATVGQWQPIKPHEPLHGILAGGFRSDGEWVVAQISISSMTLFGWPWSFPPTHWMPVPAPPSA